MKKSILLASLIILLSSGCVFKKLEEKSNEKFGDQHFKTAISLIEMYKLRNGYYPEKLDSLTYLGDWDNVIFHSVRYQKRTIGYDLDLTNGWIGMPKKLKYPAGFWKGLGCVKSNLK